MRVRKDRMLRVVVDQVGQSTVRVRAYAPQLMTLHYSQD